jgi:hypothetical protein
MKTVSEKVLFSLAVALSAFVVVIGGYLYFVNPNGSWMYLLSMSVQCVAWIVRYLAVGNGKTDPASCVARRNLDWAIVLSGSLLAVALGTVLIVRIGWMPELASEIGQRSRGFIAGMIVVFFANAIPKQVSSARGLAMLRAIGWALVLGGVGYAMAWLLMPLAYASRAAMLMLLCAVTYAVARVGWHILRRPPVPPPPC